MKEIMVLVEHRQGEAREITFEMLAKGQELAEKMNTELTAVVMGEEIAPIADAVKTHCRRVLVIQNPLLGCFNTDIYQDVLTHIINERKPSLILIGHTAAGMDLAPALATGMEVPLAADCYDIELKDTVLIPYRQMYGGKMCAEGRFKEAYCKIVTVRPGAFATEGLKEINGVIEAVAFSFERDYSYRKFLRYLEAAVGDVDITQANIVVSVGRGIGGPENLPVAEELAKLLGGVVGCSRPVADRNWLPKERQVGTSGKTVKPKFYLALGISGAFQHIVGMQGAETIIAINKDPKAPIFNYAHYGIVDDLFKVIPAIVGRLRERKGG